MAFGGMYGGGKRSKKEMIDSLPGGWQSAEKIENNTLEWVDRDGWKHIRLHRTDIVSTSPCGRIQIIRTGGYHTMLTRERIRKYSEVRCFAKDSETFVSARTSNGVWVDFPVNDELVLVKGAVPRAYVDAMWELINTKKELSTAKRTIKQMKATRKKAIEDGINEYIAKRQEAISATVVKRPVRHLNLAKRDPACDD